MRRRGQAKNKKELLTKPEWINLLRFLREKQDAVRVLLPYAATFSFLVSFQASHPKLEKVEEIVVEHFSA